MEVKDSNGNILNEGDSVILIKSLDAKGIRGTLKRGQVVKNIRFTNSAEEIEGRIDKVMMVLKTCFLKKA
jgi:protein PhnA